MALYLVQHGLALSKDIDPEKGLSDEGAREARRIAEVAKGYRVRANRIEHSGKKRARQTAEIFSAALEPEQGLRRREGLNPLDDVAAIAETLDTGQDLMLVGHLPFMERLTSYLILGEEKPTVFKFQNGGIVCLDRDPDRDGWVIKWTLMPKIG